MVDINIGQITPQQQANAGQPASYNQLSQRADNAAASVQTLQAPNNAVQALNRSDETAVNDQNSQNAGRDNSGSAGRFDDQLINNFSTRVKFDDSTGSIFIEIVDVSRENVIQRIPPESLVDFLKTTNDYIAN